MLMMAVALLAAGGWTYSEKKDAMTDEVSSGLILPAEDGKTLLILSCGGNESSVAVAWGRFIRLGHAEITYRIDGAKAESLSWRMTEDGKISIHPNAGPGGLLTTFVGEVAKAQKLLVRADAYQDGAVTAEFAVAGLAEHLPKMTCMK